MAYCTLEDLGKIMPEQDLIELTDDDVPAAVIVTANVDKAIADAGELIDGYLRARYSLPLTPAPGLINTLACDIAVYRLYARRVKLTPPEGVSERYKNALKLLDLIQKGAISLGDGGTPTPEASGDSVSVTAADRIFTRDTMEGY
jgi:phage gp36-like protein